MTDKTIARNDRGEPVKMDGWFSWRHRTRDAHDEAVEQYSSKHGRKHRQALAKATPPPPHYRTRAHRLHRCACEVAR